jgi:2'-5' RNA ligase
MPERRESAVVVPVSLPTALERLRQAYVPVASLGVPAHLTLLYPFVVPAQIGGDVVTTLRAIVANEPGFDLELSATRTFPADGASPGTTYLAPVAPEPFIRLTRAIWAAFPDYPPFEGAFADIVPHLTLTDDASLLAEVDAVARPLMPIRRRVTEAWLIVEGDDDHWTRRSRLALGRPRRPPAPAAR